MHIPRALTLAVALGLAGASSARADVQLTIRNGRVSLVATNATIRQILAEWAKIGQTTIVNGDRVSGGPVTLQLSDVPEQQALDVLLRSVSGYMAASRAVALVNASQFDRIIVMPTSVAPPSAPPRAAQAAPVFPRAGSPSPPGQPGAPQQPVQDEQDDDPPVPGTGPNRGPVFDAFPQPQVVSPQQGGRPGQPGLASPRGPLVLPPAGAPSEAPATYPSFPTVPTGGAAVPGMIVLPPSQPGQPQPGTPAQLPPRPIP
jgi:hypothetical protein